MQQNLFRLKNEAKENGGSTPKKRSGWGGLNPVTRNRKTPKVITSKRFRKIGKDDFYGTFNFDRLSHFAACDRHSDLFTGVFPQADCSPKEEDMALPALPPLGCC